MRPQSAGPAENPERYHLTLTVGGRPVAQGWWGDRTVADGKFTDWIGMSKAPDARVVLVDTETEETLASWPDPVVGGGP